MEKSKLITRLLEDKNITAEEAVVLLQEATIFKQYQPYKLPEENSCPNGPICYCSGAFRKPRNSDLNQQINTDTTGNIQYNSTTDSTCPNRPLCCNGTCRK